MLTLNPASARSWSRLGARATYGLALFELAKTNPEIMALSADLVKSSGLDRMAGALPDQVLNTGIAEQNMVGVAAGLARQGYRVFASSFAPFVSMRASEQVRMNLGYMQEPVTLVALASGVSMGMLGNSHFGIEDIAVMRSIPNMSVVCPADCGEIVKAVSAAVDHKAPLYLRLTGTPPTPSVFMDDYAFEIGRAVVVREPAHVTFVTCGTMLAECVAAADLLVEEGIGAGVLNMHTIKPLDTAALTAAADRSELIVTVEEHTLMGGLGSAVAEHWVDARLTTPLHRIGFNDVFVKTGEYRWILEQYGLTAPAIANAAQTALRTGASPARQTA